MWPKAKLRDLGLAEGQESDFRLFILCSRRKVFFVDFNLIILGLTSKNPITFTELPLFSYPTLLDQKGFWITTVKSSYLKQGNKISLILDKDNSLQLSVNYVLKANLFANKMIQISPSSKLWLIIDLYGNTNSVKFLPSDYTPYEIKGE